MPRSFRKIWGPSGRKENSHSLWWEFTAIWQDGKGQRYQLIFYANSRRFRAIRKTKAVDQAKTAAYVEAMNLGDGTAEQTGRTITEILKARLSADDIVAAQRKAILFGRTT